MYTLYHFECEDEQKNETMNQNNIKGIVHRFRRKTAFAKDLGKWKQMMFSAVPLSFSLVRSHQTHYIHIKSSNPF